MKILKASVCLFVVVGLLAILTGCPKTANKEEPKGKVYFNFFDTVSYIYSYAGDSQEQFEKNSDAVAEILNDYHQLFDIYHEYSGKTNLCTINNNAGGEPLTVDERLIDFLIIAKELYDKTNGEMNIMLGSVLRPWHDCREQASNDPQNSKIPDEQVLAYASAHTSITLLEIDEENKTVRISDPLARIDAGAFGKGYATEMAAQMLIDNGVQSYVLNIGGNIRIIGTKPDGSGWRTGIKNPQNPQEFSLKIDLSNTSCVTSGSYERFFTVDGKRYHHIIDKDTNFPASHFSSVSIICADSGLADALSTALFLLPQAEGQKLLEKTGAKAMWVDAVGNVYYSPGFEEMIRT